MYPASLSYRFYWTALIVVIGPGIAWSLVACKPRVTVESGLQSDDGASTYTPDQTAMVEAAKVRGACDSGKGSAFRGTGSGDRIDYSPRLVASNGGDGGQASQPDWYEEARFKDGKWQLSAPLYGLRRNAECLKASVQMTTEQLVAALGCTDSDPCRPADSLCSGSTCLTSLAQADFRLERASDQGGLGGDTAFALAGDELRCVEEDGWRLQIPSGGVVGEPVDTSESCEALKSTAATGLVCAWTGSAFLPARIDDGVIIGGNAEIGAKSLEMCVAMLATANGGVVCSWTGDGFAPYAVRGTAKPLGSGDLSPEIGHCAEKVKIVAGGRVCSWDNDAIKIFDVAKGAVDAEFGTFESYQACQGVVKLVADPGARATYLASLASAAQSAPSEKGGDAEPPAAEGLQLAGGGTWNWAACTDPSRDYHLVKSSGGKLVCQGKIDTLYSWGPVAKVKWLTGQPWTGRLRRDGKEAPIFTSQSAFATFGYGDFAIRFRLRRAAKFKFFDGTPAYDVCKELSILEVEDTVAVRYWKISGRTGVDYILCSLGPVHSWSVGTAEHRREMDREVLWMNRYGYKYYELYVKINGVDVVWPFGLDGHDFTLRQWQDSLQRHTALAPGAVVYNPSVEGQNETAHFKTGWPTYINPD